MSVIAMLMLIFRSSVSKLTIYTYVHTCIYAYITTALTKYCINQALATELHQGFLHGNRLVPEEVDLNCKNLNVMFTLCC